MNIIFKINFVFFNLSTPGKPLPSLNWYTKDNLTDTSYIVNALDSRVENELVIGRLERKHLDSKYECRAEINQTVLASTSVVIDLHCKYFELSLFHLFFLMHVHTDEFKYFHNMMMPYHVIKVKCSQKMFSFEASIFKCFFFHSIWFFRNFS